MAAIITEKFRINNAKQFKEDFGESGSSTYLFIGRPYLWGTDDTVETPINAVEDEIDAYEDMVSLKKVTSSDVSHGLVRRDWTSGTTYDEYAHDYSSSNTAPASSATSLYDSRFYVITDEYNVYKCIRTGRNASGSVVASTVKPTGTDPDNLVSTSDTDAASGRGYLWKYMYTVSASDVIKFVTNDFIPVKTIGAQTEVDGETGVGSAASDDGSAQWDVENNADDGEILHVRVVNGGSGYTNGTYTSVPIKGDGSGGECTVVVASNAISYVTITNEGSGYRRAQINISDITNIGGGSSGELKPIISPVYGHGSDPISELGGNYVIVNSRLEFAEGSGDFPTDNDFRRIGLVKDPFEDGTTTVASATTLAAYDKMTLSSVSGLAIDDVIRNASSDGSGVANGRVVSIDSTAKTVSFLKVANSDGGYEDFSASETVYVGSSSIGTVSSVESTFPEVERHSGHITYIENRGAVSRAADQIEDIKLIIEM